ncbi:MAG TPA: exo-alpha-sialidase [Myxococcales bacterium]|nr:exo-alpha-sialidase [Myxococcales bacterium]HIL01228.1 exo-alpha-sialidase [Myxococcales bacterium]
MQNKTSISPHASRTDRWGPGARRLARVGAIALLLMGGCRAPDRPLVAFEDAPRPLNAKPSRDPQLLVRASGAIALLAVEEAPPGGEDLRLYLSPSGGDVFTPGPRVNDWEGSVRSHGEGMPLLLEGTEGKFYAIWLGRRGEGQRGNVIRVARSDNFLKSFGPATELGASSGRGPGPAFFDATVAPDGTLIVAWLGEGTDKTLSGSSHVLVSSSHDQARTFSPPVAAAADVCPCCRPGLAADESGRWFLAWRNMDEDDVRDLAVAASRDQGATWSSAMTMPGPSWQINGCPHSGPSLRVLKGDLFVTWYTEATGQSRLYWSRSSDGGREFSAAADIAGEILDPNHPRLAEVDGRLFVVFQGRDPLAEGSWGASRPFIRAIGPGEHSPPVPVPHGEGSASYPVLSGLGAGRVVVAWTDASQSGSQVLAARGRIPGAPSAP